MRAILPPADDGGVAVGGQGDRGAIPGTRTFDGERGTIPSPHPAAAGEHPGRSILVDADRPADDGGVAVGGERNGAAEAETWLTRTQTVALLGPHPAAAGEHP